MRHKHALKFLYVCFWPSSVPTSSKASEFSLYFLSFCSIFKHRQYRPGVDVILMACSEANLERNCEKRPNFSDHSEYATSDHIIFRLEAQ
jgi:hypothetical protein